MQRPRSKFKSRAISFFLYLAIDAWLNHRSFILSPGPKSVYDVWTSHLMDNSLALGTFLNRAHPRFKIHMTTFHPGMHNRGIFIPDVNASGGFRTLDTFSDVLAIYQEPVRFFRQLPFSLMPLSS